MAFTRVAALLHAALSDVTATDHHTATVAGDLNLADLAERDHDNLTNSDESSHLGTVTQAAMEAETPQNKSLNPSRVRHSPGVAKVWVTWELDGTHAILASYNMTSVSDGGAVGDTDHLYDDDFSSADYCAVGGADRDGAVNVNTCPLTATFLGAGMTTRTQLNDGVDKDSLHATIVIYGDQ